VRRLPQEVPRKDLTMAAPEVAAVRARLWDGPVRVVHWLLVVLMLVSWLTAGENMTVHRWSGYSVMGLLIFRIYWGVFGSQTARFASFVKGPKAVAAYARTLGSRESAETPGHNPLGALSVVAILGLLVAQVSLGLFAVDIDGLESGPLSHLVEFETGRTAAEWHELTFRALQVLVVLHVAAVAFYLVWKRQNLVGAMITGRRRFAADPGLRFAPWWRLLIGAAIAFALMWFISKGLRFS
jgi:cytochrome b